MTTFLLVAVENSLCWLTIEGLWLSDVVLS